MACLLPCSPPDKAVSNVVAFAPRGRDHSLTAKSEYGKIAAGVHGGNERAWRCLPKIRQRERESVATHWHKTAGTRERTAACQFRYLHGGYEGSCRRKCEN
jgi:hypothetical protein